MPEERPIPRGMGRFVGVAALADVLSVDSTKDRTMPSGSVKFDGNPVMLTWAPTAEQGHEDGLPIGAITEALWTGSEFTIGGVFDSSELAQELRRQLLEGMPWGLSIEPSNETVMLELRPDGSSKETLVDGLLTGVLVTKEAALHGTWIKALVEEAVEPAEPEEEPVMVAGIYPAFPPAYCFEKPELDSLTPITVDGPRIFGHLAGDGCHRGFPNTCIRIGDLSKDYSQFARRTIPLDDGTQSPPVGQIAIAGGHADLRLTAAAAQQHYDDTRSAVADIAVWWDDKNQSIVCSGALRPDTTDDHLRVLLASDVSVDYRYADGERKLVAALCVNTPGFPIPPRINALVASGEVVNLILPPLTAADPGANSETEALAQRFHETYERLAPAFGYKTREESAVPWEDVPENNRQLMIAVCAEILSDGLEPVEEVAPEEAPAPTEPALEDQEDALAAALWSAFETDDLWETLNTL